MFNFIITVVILTPIICFGQQLQTYTGAFEKGTASYQYYEDENYERVFHGDFSYSYERFSVRGKFENGLRNGKWIATSVFSGKSSDYKIESTSSYLEGDLNGPSTYIKKDLSSGTTLFKCNTMFKNNVAIDYYNFEGNNNGSVFSVKIKLNKDGFADSSATIKYSYENKPHECILKFKNGFVTFALLRDMSNGKVLWKIDRPNLTEDNYDNSSMARMPFSINFGDKSKLFDLYLGFAIWNNDSHPVYNSLYDLNKQYNILYSIDKGMNRMVFSPLREMVKNDPLAPQEPRRESDGENGKSDFPNSNFGTGS